MVERAQTHGVLPHNLITREMAKEFFEETERLYRRKDPVKAIMMERKFTIETKDGIVTGHPGDYIVDALGDGTAMVIPGNIFNEIFYELTAEEKRKERNNKR